MGLRLPLRSIAWVTPPAEPERSLFAPATPLPAGAVAPEEADAAPADAAPARAAPVEGRARYSGRVAADKGQDASALAVTDDDPLATGAPGDDALADGTPREPEDDEREEDEDDDKEEEATPITALCVELRDGHACVFLPPLAEGAHAVELIATVEQAAAETGVPVVVEGYPPPPDPGLSPFQRDARPRRDRGEHPSLALVARARAAHDGALRGGQGGSPRRVRSSSWTAPTPAPAAAAT